MSTGLNIENTPALLEYLKARGILAPGETPAISQLEGGVSNRVVLVQPRTGQPFVLKQALEKLRVQVDWFCPPSRNAREAFALRFFAELAPRCAIPALIFEDPDHHLFAMAEIPEPRQNWKQMLLSGHLVPDHVREFGTLLGTIHRESAQRGHQLAPLFEDRTIFEVLRLEPYYGYTRLQFPQVSGFLDQLTADTLACRISLVHGDYSPKNILVHQDKLVLLDFEAAHFGDPAFDVGFSLAHFLGKANHLRDQRMQFAQAALTHWKSYQLCISQQPWSKELEPRAVRHTLGCSLGRVAGRSPLEYLTPDERSTHANAVLQLMRRPPALMENLITEFVERITCR